VTNATSYDSRFVNSSDRGHDLSNSRGVTDVDL
jgi:hypothetical protein